MGGGSYSVGGSYIPDYAVVRYCATRNSLAPATPVNLKLGSLKIEVSTESKHFPCWAPYKNISKKCYGVECIKQKNSIVQ